MAGVNNTKSFKSKTQGWPEANIELNRDKIKNLRLVCRGGQATWPNGGNCRQRTFDSDSNMVVDCCDGQLTNQFYQEEIKKSEPKPMIHQTPAFNNKEPSYKRHCDSKHDQEGTVSYITLIQEVQRKRKFNDISNELSRPNYNSQFGVSVSRRQRLLNEINRNVEIPGKTYSDNSKIAQISSEISQMQISKLSQEVDDNDASYPSNKRARLVDLGNSSDSQQVVSLARVRRDRQLAQESFGYSQ